MSAIEVTYKAPLAEYTTMEEWKSIPCNAGYEASNTGKIRNAKTKREIKTAAAAKKYHVVALSGVQYPVHRLVAQTFLENPDNLPFVNHKDSNKRNNHVDNLEWITNADNVKHAVAQGRAGREYMKNGVKVTYPDGKEEWYDSTSAAEKSLGLCTGTVNRVSRKCDGYVYTNNTQKEWRFRLEYHKGDEDSLPDGVEERPVTIEGYHHLTARSDGTLYNTKFKRAVIGGNDGGYRRVKSLGCGKESKALHIIIATTFIPNPDNKPYVNHIDGNKTNNAVSNLEWCTQSENMLHAFRTGLISEEAKKLIIEKVSVPVYQLEFDGSIIARHDNIKKAAEAVGAHAQAITAVCKNYLSRTTPHHTAGYGWCYIEDHRPKMRNPLAPELASTKDHFNNLREHICYKTPRLPKTAVCQLNKSGVLIQQFPSADEAAKLTGINKYTILKVCNKEYNTSGGFRWCYAEDLDTAAT